MTTRRKLLKMGLTSVVALPLVDITFADVVEASPDEGIAKQFGYVRDGSKTDNPKYDKSQDCANCVLFNPETSVCNLFQGQKVQPKGWCTAWAKRPGS